MDLRNATVLPINFVIFGNVNSLGRPKLSGSWMLLCVQECMRILPWFSPQIWTRVRTQNGAPFRILTHMQFRMQTWIPTWMLTCIQILASAAAISSRPQKSTAPRTPNTGLSYDTVPETYSLPSHQPRYDVARIINTNVKHMPDFALDTSFP